MNAKRRLRGAVVVFAAVALSAVLTGCQGDDVAGGTGSGVSAKPTGKGKATPGAGATATPSSGSDKGSGTGSGSGTGKGSGSGTGKGSGSGSGASAVPAGKGSAAPAADCVSKAPNPDDYDPDEFAVYGWEKLDGSTGKVNLIVQHGAWGCPEPDTDGAPFVVSGEESRWAMDQAAYVTATNPIVETTENQRIGVQELLDWLDAHPDSGLVFKYETGADGAIHRLDEVFTP